MKIEIISYNLKNGVPGGTSNKRIMPIKFNVDGLPDPVPGTYALKGEEYIKIDKNDTDKHTEFIEINNDDTGKNKSVTKVLLSKPAVRDFLTGHKSYVQNIMAGAKSGGKEVLRLNYGCEQGLRRSVFIAEEIFKWLQEDLKYETTVEHTSLNN
jgi:hypothetical protein